MQAEIGNKIDIRGLIDETLIYLGKNNYKNEIDKAFKFYKSPFKNDKSEIDIEHGFNDWLIHDYKKSDGLFIVEDYLKNKNSLKKDELGNIIKNSVFSIFKISIQNKHTVFKDIITNIDYIIDTDENYSHGEIIKIRVYPVGKEFCIIEEGVYYQNELESTIRKSVMSKYNEYCSVNKPMSIAEFVKVNSILIYHLTNIIEFYEAELVDEDDLKVLVATYAIKKGNEVVDKLLENSSFQLLEKNNDEVILIIIHEGSQAGEVLVLVNTVEVEATSRDLYIYSKSLIEETLEELIVFVKDEELNLEDLL